ncbi:unnamed protein product [Miscanthus lutarioriparius]|uniref:AAA+ ATPase domain-containing protein n=1 Tax=Miscanthus lutarioriparius TaxID=422564 RepID=A0A811SBP4_9POAL|nr:unnamed protein product [Miscanthus lutarioriparius]
MSSSGAPAPAAAMAVDDAEDDQLASMSTEDIIRASRLLDNEIRVLKDELQRTNLELESFKEKVKENQEKIKLNKQLPYLVGNIVEILEMNHEDEAEEDGANIDLDSQRKGKCVVLKTSTRQTIFLPVVGLVDPDKLKPGDLVGVNKDSYLILDTLPSEYDSRVKAMEVDEKPTEDYNDIGGLEKQIQELVEAIVLPMTHKDRFQKLGIRPPKGVLLYGPPGTGKTLMARACAAQTNATFLKLAGPQLVQMFIGDGAKLVRDAFQLAKEKAPCIIFIDEIDAIGTKRFDSEVSGDREVQRTMLELLNQLDGFSSDERIKVIAATNRADILDPALMRSGRLDRKIEFPHPSEEARARILQIHSRKMNVNPDVNFEELARSTDDFNGAQLKAVCVEAGMLALRRDATEVTHEDFNEGIVQASSFTVGPPRSAISSSAAKTRKRKRGARRIGIIYGPMEERDRIRLEYLNNKIWKDDTTCLNMLRLNRDKYFRFCKLFRDRGLLKDTIHLCVEQQVGMFLNTVGHNLRNRLVGTNFDRSGETAIKDAVEEVGATSGHATWTSAMSAFMLSHLANLVASGLKTSKGFKKHFYNGCVRAINEKFNTIRTGDQVKNHLKTWQKKWAKIIKLKKLSGALFDEDNCMITLDDEHYNGHVKDHKSDAEFLNKPILHYKEMEAIFGNSMATGNFAKDSSAALGNAFAGSAGTSFTLHIITASPSECECFRKVKRKEEKSNL